MTRPAAARLRIDPGPYAPLQLEVEDPSDRMVLSTTDGGPKVTFPITVAAPVTLFARVTGDVLVSLKDASGAELATETGTRALVALSGDVTVRPNLTAIIDELARVSVSTQQFIAEAPSRYAPIPTYLMPAPNGTDDTAAMDAVVAAAMAASPYRHQIVMRAGTYRRTAPLVLNVGYSHLIGAGMYQTTIAYSGSSGYAVDAIGSPTFEGFTIDGATATGSAGAFRLNGDIKNVSVQNVAFMNFNTSVPAVRLAGASQNLFSHCFWGNNARNLELIDNGPYAPNENSFWACNLGNTVGTTGAAVSVTNGEANSFTECLIQSARNLNTFHISNTAGATGFLTRGNRIVGCYFEENGFGQSGSRGIYVQGASGRVIEGTIIRDNRFFQSAQDNPSRQIELTFTSSTTINGNYASLGFPHIITFDGGNNTNVLVGDNSFIGVQQLGRASGPASSLYLPGASGNFVSTPDSAPLSMSGDFEVVFLIAPDDWTPSVERHIISKDTAAASGRSWAVSLTTLGMGNVWFSADGTNMFALTAVVPFGFTDGAWGWGRVTFDADNGSGGRTARFFRHPYVGDTEPTSWELIDTRTSAGAISLADTTTQVEIGSFAGGVGGSMFLGRIGRVIVRNALSGGTIVASADFTAPRSPRHRDSAGNTWTLNGSAWAWA